jgi:hypothetical protein
VPEMAASKNDATSFRPYNPGEIVGSTSPGLPYIPPAASNGCGYIIALVVIIAVSIFVPYLAPVLQGPLGVGLTAAKAIATGIVTFGAHAVSSAIGSASGMTTFSWRNSAAQGIAAGLTAGLAGKLGSTAELAKSFAKTPTMMGAAKIAASAVGGAMTSYAGNKIAGVQGTSFSWKAVSAGAVANVVTASIGNALNLTPKYENGVLSTGNFGNDFAYSAIGGVVNLHTRRQFGFDDKVDYGAIAMDAFGNALGNAIGGQISDALSIRNMNPEQRQSYESSRAGGFSKGQSIAYAMDTGGLRSMGSDWFGLGDKNAIVYSEPGASRSQRVLSGTGGNLTSAQIKMMTDEFNTLIAPKLEALEFHYDKNPVRGSKEETIIAFEFAKIAAPFTNKYGYEVGANIVSIDNRLFLTDVSLGYYNKANGRAQVSYGAGDKYDDYVLASAHTHPFTSGDGLSGHAIMSYGAVSGDYDMGVDYSREQNGYVFKLDAKNILQAWRFDYVQFKYDVSLFRNTKTILDSRGYSPTTHQPYVQKITKP